ncbi:P22 phage major capsid protein family protein [Salmonella enterica]|uniref:P22 phage major capsid protein family protein n=1 Tax=Salmonella enterica TaxID=28901 RepID=UPI000FC0560A|nr:P22 phage major capsid protein family protein [Salmonella enterica]ECC3110249.1 coat protein [Salmonella enterica subsp. enterica]EDB4175917.1 coat protein [Salmonella enterica subsp. enterica serovar Poona]EEJ7600374.1 coat protein [Salmonella enterica subsp. enterica serovar Kiambu]EAX6325070.1 coat protein [Salmonella enterica]EAX6329056.1 coat protein [Salmonella enterica]
MSLKEGQLVTYAIDEIIETVQNLTPMASKTSKYTPPAASMQRSSNTVWMPVEQEAPTQTGWDLTNKQTNVLELSVKCNMGDPDNDFFQLRADDLRDERSYRHRIQASAKKLANNIETAIAKQATEMGSLVVHDARSIGPSTGLTGWDFLASAEELMFARELNRDMGISYFLNPSDYRKAGRDLTAGDIFGRVPEDAYHNGTIQRQVAGFDDVMRSPKLPTVVGSTVTGVTVTGAQKFKPQAFTTDTDGNNENVDNRVATVVVSSTTGLKRGDKISFAGVKYLSQMAKNVLTDDATFSITRVIDGTHIEITPKPVALDDATLTAEEKAYANVNTSLAASATVTLLNVASTTANIGWADDSIRLLSQPIPVTHELFAGMKTQSFSIPGVGINGIFATQGDINTLTGLCRIAVWYSACAVRPEAIVVGLPNQTAP